MKRLFARPSPLQSLTQKRSEMLRSAELSIQLEKLLAAALPAPETPLAELSFLLVDFAADGQAERCDEVLSIGSVMINHQRLELQSASHHYIRNQQQLLHEDLVIRKHIVPEILEQGVSLDAAMNELFLRMQQRVVVIHNYARCKKLLNDYLTSRYGIGSLPLLWLDNQALARLLEDDAERADQLSIQACRQRHGLPDYREQNALMDAVAVGELFLIYCRRLAQRNQLTLANLLELSAS